ncbi:hypothetical protein [Cupriavidus necator]|uniref:Uncharacterized protein n=1 Tax=Cupriavidus pinatubonensis (strain JMP 134 / LMG 1197) TaxID=264198 RepID=Q46MZ2_CUPPJ|nr:hypothetical protein [Cupriavidus necator]
MHEPNSLKVRPFRAASAIALLIPGMCHIALANASTPLLRCEISQGGGDPKIFDFKPTTDPYSVKSVDIDGYFRFKAVMVGAAPIAYIKLYTYYQDFDRVILLHEAKYVAPAVPSKSDSTGSFTGSNLLYSPVLGRELQYRCRLMGAA